MKKKVIKLIPYIIISILIIIVMAKVYADYLYNSNNVYYNNSGSSLNASDVQGAIDELYNKCETALSSNDCPEGFVKINLENGFSCKELNKLYKVTFNANGGTFPDGSTTNEKYYSIGTSEITKISKTNNIDDNGDRLSGTDGYMQSTAGSSWAALTDIITIEGAESLEVSLRYGTNKNTGSQYIAVYDNTMTPTYCNMESSISGKLSQGSGNMTYIISGNTAKFYFSNAHEHTDSYSNYYGYYAKIKGIGNYASDEGGEYIVPTNPNNNQFYGWTENPDGTGKVYKNEEEIRNPESKNKKEITLYAKYGVPICKRSTSIFNFLCQSSDGCYNSTLGSSCQTFGQIGTLGQLNSGDIFDCDVNGDGIYDIPKERFYYVSDYYDTINNTWDSTTAVLIYYNNTISGSASTNGSAWYSSNSTSNGPITAKNNMPTTSQWSNVSLKNTSRNILVVNSDGTISSIKKTGFDYSGKAARLLTYQEVYAGCYDGSISLKSDNSLSKKCKYLLYNTRYTGVNKNGPWLESLVNNSNAWAVTPSSLSLSEYSGITGTSYGARPVIEVPKSQIEY